MEKQDMQLIIEMLAKAEANRKTDKKEIVADRKADKEKTKADIQARREKIAAETEAFKART
jgi:hypothetical protein